MNVKHFPQDMSALEIDRTKPRSCLISGLFEESVDVAGSLRRFYTYITPGLPYNQRCVVVCPPDEVETLSYIENSFWTEFADREQVFLHILDPGDNGWNTDGSDAEFLNKVYMAIQARKYYITMQDNIYAVGIGRGALVAQQAVMKMTSEWSGLATFGDMDDNALVNALASGGGQATGATELAVSGAKAQIPVWMCWSGNTGMNAEVCGYWKRQNNVDPEMYSSQWADEIYFPTTVRKKDQVNDEQISQVRVTNGFEGEPDAEMFDAVWAYVKKACRHRCFGTKALRNYADPIEYGAKMCTIEHQGFARTWYEYVPDSVKDSGVPVPLVVCMHGRGGSAESFMDMSGMNKVAEERGFIVIFPEAGVYQIRPGALRNLLLWNGQFMDERVDDTGFVLKAIEDIKSRYNIDNTRVYACGQSSGGMMASDLAVAAPGVFAAVSPWSAIVNPDFRPPLPESIDPAVPYMFLMGENDWLCVDRENGELEYHVSKMIADFLRNLMKLYKLDTVPKTYKCGEITWYVYQNAQRVPMLTVGTVKGMTHANYPRESWIAYDEFLCKFAKAPDGTLTYMGEAVE